MFNAITLFTWFKKVLFWEKTQVKECSHEIDTTPHVEETKPVKKPRKPRSPNKKKKV